MGPKAMPTTVCFLGMCPGPGKPFKRVPGDRAGGRFGEQHSLSRDQELILLPKGTGPGAVSIFLSMCEVQWAELGMGWMEPGQLGFRGGLHFISLSLSFLICKMGII